LPAVCGRPANGAAASVKNVKHTRSQSQTVIFAAKRATFVRRNRVGGGTNYNYN
jgi:hypothetical protein